MVVPVGSWEATGTCALGCHRRVSREQLGTQLFRAFTTAMRKQPKPLVTSKRREFHPIVSNNSDNWYSENTARRTTNGPVTIDRDRDGVDDRAEGAGTGAGIGATAGGVVGLVTGLGLLAIPGVGPVVAAGWLASLAVGAAVGGTAGGIIGALTQAGTSKEDAYMYAEGIRRGGTLVSARVADGDRDRCEAMLDRSSVNIRDRGAAWRKTGWQNFDPNAAPYTAEQLRNERYPSSVDMR
jgi:hypothetical protein